jgi:hypothetical protein
MSRGISPTSEDDQRGPFTVDLATEEANMHFREDRLPLFDIEKDGDPRIAWEMYYDFKVDGSDAYYELQPAYLATPRFPSRKRIDSSDS